MLKNNRFPKSIRPLQPIPISLNPGGTLSERLKAVLLDVYGTLFISASGDIGHIQKESRKMRRLKKLLRKHKVSMSPDAVLTAFFNAIEKKHAELRQKGIDYPEVEIDQIWMNVLEKDDIGASREFAEEFEWIVNPAYPMPNLKKLISAIRRSNVLSGIISNAQFFTPHLFRRFLGSDPLTLGFCPDLVLFSYQFGYAKPSAFLFETAARTLKNMNIPAQRVLYMGNDMLNDIYPAKRVGFKTALFAGDERSLRLRQDDPRCKGVSADLIVTDLIQLTDYL